jgi:hypothetical protein
VTKIIVRFPYTDDEFNYGTMIAELDEFLHKKLDSGDWKYEIYREES